MKKYTVYLTEKIKTNEVLVKAYFDEAKSEIIDLDPSEYYIRCDYEDTFDFSSLSAAKKFIKDHIDIYKGSCGYKYWSDGDWEPLPPIKINGCNKTHFANTKQQKESYA